MIVRILPAVAAAALAAGCASSSPNFGAGFADGWSYGGVETVWSADVNGSGWNFGLDVAEDTLCAVTPEGEAYVLSLEDGEQLARAQFSLPEGAQAGACDSQRAFVIHTDGIASLHSIADASELWRTDSRRPVLGAPVLAGDSMIIFGADGTVEAWSANAGEPLWEHNEQAPSFRLHGYFRPLAAGGNVYFGLPTGELLGLATDTGVLLWQRPLQDLADPDPTRTLTHIAAPGQAGSSICAAAFRGWLACFDAETGDEAWQAQVSSAGAVAATDAEVFAVDDAGTLRAYDSGSGKELWEAVGASAGRTPPMMTLNTWAVSGWAEMPTRASLAGAGWPALSRVWALRKRAMSRSVA